MSDGSQRTPTSSTATSHTTRVDPKLPLLRPISPSRSLQNPLAPNGGVSAKDGGLGRTTSRRRKAGEQGDIRSPVEDNVLPAAPDVPESPRGPPVSYRIPFSNGDVPLVRSNSSKSFAARAGAIPDRVDPSLANSITANRMPVLENGAHARRGSTGQSSGVSSAQVEQSAAQLASPFSANASSPQQSSHAAPPKLRIPSDRTPPQPVLTSSQSPTNSNSVSSPIVSSPMRSGSRRVSAGGAERRTEWAPDRSPLQKLEVKLNDISKEEKRARVQEAEQLLRDSQAADATQRNNSNVQRTGSKRTAIRSEPPERATYQDQMNQQNGQNALPSGTNRYSASRGLTQDMKGKGHERQIYSVGLIPGTAEPLGGRSLETPNSPTSYTNPARSRRRSADVSNNRRREERGVRFQNSEYNVDAETVNSPFSTSRANSGVRAPSYPGAASSAQPYVEERNKVFDQPRVYNGHNTNTVDSPRRVPTQQQKLYSEKAKGSSHRESNDGAPDPFPGYPSHDTDHALKYELPPQSTAGINARESVGFGSRAAPVTAEPEPRRHHVSDFLHLHRDIGQQSKAPHLGPPKHLDEWRKGGIARLTLADIISDDDNTDERNAWWEGGGSASKRRSSASADVNRGSLALDGGYEGTNGMVQFPSPAQSTVSFQDSRAHKSAVRARQYIGYDGTPKPKQRNRSWRREPRSLIGLRLASHLRGVLHLHTHIPVHNFQSVTLLTFSIFVSHHEQIAN